MRHVQDDEEAEQEEVERVVCIASESVAFARGILFMVQCDTCRMVKKQSKKK